MLTKRRRNGDDRYHKRITDDEFDYLVVVCQEDAIYVIPKEKLLSDEAGKLMRLFHIKPPIEKGRRDSKIAGQRWEPYKNNFNLNGESYEQTHHA